VYDDQVPEPLLEPCEPLLIPGRRGAAQQQMERWRGQGLMQAAGNLAPKQRGVGEAVAGAGASTQPWGSFDGGQAARVANPELTHDADAKGPQPAMAERQGDDKGRQRRPSPPDNGVVCGLHPEQDMGEREHRVRHRAALGIVAVQQRL
jgi:hypothetical protein